MNETVLTNALRFFDAAHRHFLSSRSRTGEVEKFYRLAEFTICLKFAGDALVDFLTPALKHLEIVGSGAVDFTICIWDSVSTGTPSMEFPWPSQSYALHGNVIGYDCDRIHTVFDPQLQILQVFDKERDLALYWIKDQRNTPWWIGTSPLLFILHWWMKGHGFQLTHAAVVGTSEGGVLLAGKSGSGKSTTSLACMRAGMRYVSEDYCLVSDLPQIWAHSLYNSAKVEEKTLSLFPELRTHIVNPERPKKEKAYFFHHRFQPENILACCPLKALVSLTIEDARDCWLESIGPNDAVAALSVTTLWQLTHTGPAVFNHLKRVAAHLPCYRLHLGSDLMQAPRCLEKIL